MVPRSPSAWIVSGLLVLSAGCAATPGEPSRSPAGASVAERTQGSGTDAAAGPLADPPRLAPEDPHGFSVEDLLDMRRLGEVTVAPGGRTAAFVVRLTDLAADRMRSDLYTVDLEAGSVQRRTRTAENEYAPAFSADGSLLYHLVGTGEGTELRALDLAGGGTKVLRSFPLTVSGLAVVPGEGGFLVAADLFAGCDMACTKQRLAVKAEEDSATAYEGLFVRHWDTWKDGRRSRLIYVPPGDGAPVVLTDGVDADVPSKPFGGFEEVAVTPDGRQVVFAARAVGRTEPWSTNFDLFRVPIGGGKVEKLTDNPAWDTRPVLSPDGGTLAYLATERPGYESDRFRLVLRDLASGRERVLTRSWDRSIREFVFSPDGSAVVATAQHLGQVGIFRIDLNGGTVTPLWTEGTASQLAFAGSRLLFALDDLAHPADLYTLPAEKGAGARPERVTDINADRLAAVKMGTFEQFRFRGAGGDTVYGYLVRPPDVPDGRKVPVAFLIHGGPQGSFGNHFHYRWNPQVYAGAGYAAVMIDFHGSTGYGQAFTDAIRGDWGGKPLVDLQKGWKHVQAAYPFLDGQRACALGASYGGFMINWIAGRWPDGFRCLVNHDGVFDMRSMYYATEELWFPEWEQHGPYFDNPRQHEKFNPVRFVDRWKTPMLVIHGSLDYRVPIEQGLGAFTALVRRNVPARFLHFPDENHWVLRPKNAVRWHREVLGWLDRHLEGDGAPAEPPQ